MGDDVYRIKVQSRNPGCHHPANCVCAYEQVGGYTPQTPPALAQRKMLIDVLYFRGKEIATSVCVFKNG